MAREVAAGAAFFHFDTDIEQATKRVRDGISEMAGLIARAEGLSGFQAPELRSADFVTPLREGSAQLQHLIGQLKDSKVSVDQFRQGFRALIENSTYGMRKELGRAFDLTPEPFRNELEIARFGRQAGQVYVDALFNELSRARSRDSGLRTALTGEKFSKAELAPLVDSLASEPYVFSDNQQRIRDNARLERLAREIARRRMPDPFDDEGGLIVNPDDEALLRRLGLSSRFEADPLLSSIKNTGRKPAGYGSTYVDQEKALDAVLKKTSANATMENRHAEALRKSADEAQRLARWLEAGRIVDAGRFRFSPRLGEYGLDTKAGIAPLTGGLGELRNAESAINRKLQSEAKAAEALAKAAAADTSARLRADQPYVQQFMAGFTSRGFGAGRGAGTLREALGNELATFGTVARYTVLYQTLFALQRGFTDTVQEALDFRDSLTDLNVAFGPLEDASQGYVNTLQRIAAVSGGNTGAALDSAARGIRAFGQESRESGGDIEHAGEDIARASAQIALIASKDLRDATGDVIAIASAFSLSAEEANQVVDAISAAKDFGGDPKQIAQGLANFATTAKEAGFSVSEAANVLSTVVGRVDESGQAAATRLSRIISTLGGTTGQNLIQALNNEFDAGIDPTASIRDQLYKIAQVYETAGPEIQGRIRNALGGTSSIRELLPLLDTAQLDLIFQKAGESAGRGLEEYRRKTGDLVGLLTQLKGDISAIQVNLFRGGAFDGLGLALKAIEPGVEVLGRLLGVIDDLTGKIPGLQTFLGTMLDIKLALLAINAVSPDSLKRINASTQIRDLVAPRVATAGDVIAAGAGAGLLSGAAEAAGQVASDSQAEVIASTAEEALIKKSVDEQYEKTKAALTGQAAASGRVAKADDAAAAAAERRAAADNVATAATERRAAADNLAAGSTAVGGGGSRLAGFLGRLRAAGPAITVAAAVGVAYSLFKAQDARDSIRGTERRNATAIRGIDFNAPDAADQIKAARLALAANAGDLREEQQGTIGGLLNKGLRDDVIAQTHANERYLAGLEQRLRAEKELAISTRSLSLFGADAATSAETLAAGLDQLSKSGVSTAEFIRQLYGATELDPNQHKTAPTSQPVVFSEGLVTTALKDLAGLGKQSITRETGQVVTAWDPNTGKPVSTPMLENITAEDLANQFGNDTKTREKVAQAIRDKVASYGLKDGEFLNDQQMAEIAGIILKGFGLDGAKGGKVGAELSKKMLDGLKASASAFNAPAGSEITDYASFYTYLYGDGDKNPGAFAGIDARLQMLPEGATGSRLALLKAKRDLAVSRAAHVRKGANGEEFLAAQEIASATEEEYANALLDDSTKLREARQLRAKTAAQVHEIGAEAFKTDVASALENDSLDTLIRIFNLASQVEIAAARKAAQDAKNAAAAYVKYLSGEGHGSPRAIDHALSEAQQAAADVGLIDTASDYSTAPPKQKDSQYYTGPSGAAGNTKGNDLTAAQKAALLRQARVRPDDDVGQAAAAIQVAKANLAAAEKGTSEYYSALRELNQAQFSYAQAVAGRTGARAGVTAALRGGEVAQARAAVAQAAATLRVATHGTTAYYQALASYYEAQRSLSDALRTAYYNKIRAGSDLTNPVTQAAIALREARKKLAQDQARGAGSDVLTEDRIAVRQAQASLESEAFNQRLHDVQVAEQLGQVSHQQYINYLQHEHDRLTAVHNKSRQQIEQLQEIDLALKAASEQMQGQFNLGDIKIPTPYEVRRAVQAGGLGAMSSSQTTSVVNIQVDGADTGQILTVLSRYLGPLATQRSTVSSRKV